MTPAQSEPVGTLTKFLSSKLGVPTFVVSTVLAAGGPFLAYQKAFNDGWSAYEDALRDGTAKLDGKVVEIISGAQKEALTELDRIQGEADAAQAAQQALAEQLVEKDRVHAQTIAALAGRNFTPEERDWRDDDVPVSTSLRLDAALAARAGRDSEPRMSTPIDLAGAFSRSSTDARPAE